MRRFPSLTREGSILVEAVAAGVCGTDVEIVEGKYGWAPEGSTRLVLGHESLGRVIDPGFSRAFQAGDLVVGIVRRPDPVPCPACAVGEWDMCRNGQYTERGIKQIHGFMSERWRIEPEYAIKVDPCLGLLGVLLEPTTVIVKALEQVVFIGRRSFWEPRTLLVTGAGPIGLLAALAAQDVRTRRSRPCPDGVRPEARFGPGLGCHLSLRFGPNRSALHPDVILECTGVGQVIAESIASDRRPVASVCLTGRRAWWCSHRGGHRQHGVFRSAEEQRHRRAASTPTSGTGTRRRKPLARADRSWLARLITRRERPGKLPAGALRSRTFEVVLQSHQGA